MSTHLLSDESVAEIEFMTQRALHVRELLPRIALEFVLTTETLLKDRRERCQLIATHAQKHSPHTRAG